MRRRKRRRIRTRAHTRARSRSRAYTHARTRSESPPGLLSWPLHLCPMLLIASMTDVGLIVVAASWLPRGALQALSS